ncbi:uncharacterized protein LOC126987132 [Eriocheir sinensis]|uniref:uncharacterized protein LOC126987132 n=1 Tax=Eriocheir sinensis TaxID=95602 RepID=UPI0021C7A701|nr:uncharacterized protein LOC126987132 [Eriocheir sinensis]
MSTLLHKKMMMMMMMMMMIEMVSSSSSPSRARRFAPSHPDPWAESSSPPEAPQVNAQTNALPIYASAREHAHTDHEPKADTTTTYTTTTSDHHHHHNHPHHHHLPPLSSPLPVPLRNQSSRFFSVNNYGGTQTLDLGLSFTVPFLSIPIGSLLNLGNSLGTSTSSAMTSLLDVNWGSLIYVGAAVLLASLLLPKLSALLGTAVTSGVTGYSSSGTTSFGGSSYGRDLSAAAPFTAIISQIEEALSEYDLDADSCMSRAVCSFVSTSDAKVRTGTADGTQLLALGLAKSRWVKELMGDNSVTRAIEMGQEDGDCSIQYPECPASLPGMLRALISLAT